jgi:CheY-like chemotaxis protein
MTASGRNTGEPVRFEECRRGLDKEDEERTMARTAPLSALRGRRVLVAEDEYFFAIDLSHELEIHGALVVGPVPRVEDGLELLARESPPDLAILDVNLGGSMVFPLADALIARGVPFVFATAYTRPELPPAYAGMPHCEKPVNVRRIAELLANEQRRPAAR